MEESSISLMRQLAYERVDGWNRMIVPRHSEVVKTSFLDAQNLIIDVAGMEEERNLPSIQELLETI